MTYQMNISLNDVLNGVSKNISLRKEDGSTQSVSVNIPKGIESGKKLRLKGKGGQSPMGGQPGDLFLQMTVTRHPIFTRDGANLVMNKIITYPEACLGTKVEVTSLENKKFMLKIPEGTQAGAKLRLKGYGLPKGNSGERGDIFVKIGISVPKNLNDMQKELVVRLQSAGL